MDKTENNMRTSLDLTSTQINLSDNSDFRKILVGGDNLLFAKITNKVVTARYTLLSWIPKSLLMQFTRINNVYFLIMSILSVFPFSPKNPYTLGGTLAAVLIFTMFKEGYEDLARHRQDNEVNSKLYHKFDYKSKEFYKVKSQDIRVGDILKINENESLPADLVMLWNSHPKGLAFVNTMNLDGETNLKEKVLASQFLKINSDDELQQLTAELFVDHPNISLVKWNCNLKYNKRTDPLTMQQLLLRGCILKNTDWAYGIVIYTGNDSKIVMNSKKAPSKSSNIQKKMNWLLISVFALQIMICLIFAGIGESWLKNNQDHVYINLNQSSAGDYILKTLTFWVWYSTLIPISLYVFLEILRLVLANFIKNDISMYDEATDRPAKCRASDLIEELGQVSFIFSDKTGTLTCNEMIFRRCFINDQVYGSNDLNISEDPFLKAKMNGKDKHVDEFFLMMALCNSVFPTVHEGKEVYQASSPDELALVEAAKSMGFVLKERNEGKVFIEARNNTQAWDLLVEVPFNSDRKRMSVILQHPESGKITLFTKGADTKMLPLLANPNLSYSKDILYEFAVAGLRTLVLASKELTKKEFDDWYVDWKNIQLSSSKDKDDLLDKHAELIENKLNLIGITAIEDRLQEGVPETIKILMQADIKIWVLTGDKEETAIEIAKSCNLIQPKMMVRTIFTSDHKGTEESINRIFNEFKLSEYPNFESLKNLEIQSENGQKGLVIVINGIALSFVLESKELKEKFFKLGFISNSCVCCRVSPSQKMLVVRLSSTFGKWISLAIGDGANDVSMIQEAHIGVGISGKEGTQAAQAAEFTFCQFRSLKPLLLVHGRYAYLRISVFIMYYFYKNFLSVFTELWFTFFSGFSGQIYFLDWLPSLYNTFWTSWPCLTYLALERDISPENSLKFFNLYSAGQREAYFNLKNFWMYIIFAFFSACWIFWLPVVGFYYGSDSSGREASLFWISTVSFILLIHTVNLKLLLTTQYWPKVSLFTTFLSFFFFYIMTIVLNTVPVASVFQPELPGLFFEILGNGKTWIICLVGPILALIPDFLYTVVQQIFFVNPSQKVVLYLKKHDNKSVNTKKEIKVSP